MSIHRFEIQGSGGLPVRGEVWAPEHTRRAAPVVIGIHGFKGFRRWGFWPEIATRMNALGFPFVSWDASHNGVGPGGLEFDEPDLFERNTWAREEDDLARVVEALRCGALPARNRTDTSRIGLLGHSRGGGLAVVHAASDRSVHAVVGLAPVATTRRFTEEETAEGLRRGFIPVPNSRTGMVLRFGRDAIEENLRRTDLHDIPTHHASRLTCPLLVVHGEADEAVPPSEGRRLAAAAPGGRFVGIEGADHVLGCRHPWAGPTPAFERFFAETWHFLRTALGD